MSRCFMHRKWYILDVKNIVHDRTVILRFVLQISPENEIFIFFIFLRNISVMVK